MLRTRRRELGSTRSTPERSPEPSALADGAEKSPRHSWLRVAAALVAGCLAVAIGLLVLGDDQQQADLSPDPQPATPDPVAAAAELLAELERLLGADDLDPTELTSPGDRAAQRELAAMVANVRALRVVDLAVRYVDEADLELPQEALPSYGTDPFVTEVQLSWRLRGIDRTTSALEVPIVLSWNEGEAVFESARVTEGYQVPLWFLQRVAVRRTPRTLVLAEGATRARVLERQALTAVATVRRTVPSWRETLVVEEAATDALFESASGLSPEDARTIAAVTTTTDGSELSANPVHIYVNPQVFNPLGPRGQQIVLSHEAAHVALGAATSAVPLWLSEGIADYVALVDTSLPVAALAAQIRALVREDGPPTDLPAGPEFDGSNPDIGAWYEAAWLAARLIAQQHGQRALFELYRTIDRTGDVGRAFRTVLETSEREFVRDWRDQLVSLAD